MKARRAEAAAAAEKTQTQEKIGWPPESNVVDDKVTCAAHSAAVCSPRGKMTLGGGNGSRRGAR